MKTAEIYTHTHTHTQLRRCLAVLLFAILPYNSFATNACVENDTVAVVLDPRRYTNDFVAQSNATTWSGSVGNARGIIACLSDKHETQQWHAYNRDILIDNDVAVIGGEHNYNLDTGYSYCWCKMIYPIVSRWVLRRDDGDSLEDCIRDCANHCQYSYKQNDIPQYELYRSEMFNSANQHNP